jgi:hypothetical protein
MLIARRRALRGGVRFFHRGIDEEGNVANYCELEQVVFLRQQINHDCFKDEVYSHCQIRGSCPFFWTQVDEEGHKEKVHIENKDDLLRHTEYF